ncbi:ABC transporter substrate-binding protein [Serratia quinivorans]|uniref:ABC transporter substrate-binding protein n=1 Tax=Serratia quinivorans TaxID=137545 RepID=UPI002178C1E7|nr:ABC transporter substrate-binding protein [Serratia quinivorans]CAI0897040.1 Nickel-binding periplasmic protein precursor [Serratia quinivorans]CAI1549572.1 Nickel-binding periplasmic protein precursor [Serratia quinivorans]
MLNPRFIGPTGCLLAGSLLLGGCFDPAEPKADAGEERRIRLAMLQPPRSGLTPLSDDAFKLSRWSNTETLVLLNANGDAEPALATEWQQIDQHRWRFVLRPGVSFHDGSVMTAQSVVRSLSAAINAAPKPRILDGIELSVSIEGDHAVIISTAVPDPLLPQRLSSPQLAILAERAYGANGVVNPLLAGTGAFVLTEINGTSSARLKRFEGYWGQKAAAPGIDVSFVPDGSARAAALRTGSADLVEAVPVSQLPLIAAERIHEVPMPRTNTLYLNTRVGVFSDPQVRAAAAAAIERQPLVDNVYEGRADVASGLLGPALPWAAPLRQPQPLLPTKTVTNKTITLATFSDRAELPEVAVYLAQQLGAAGFVVKQEVREYAHIEADALAGKFDAFILSRATVLDSGDPLAYMFSDFACQGSFNIAQLCDPQVDAAITQAAAIAAGAQRRQAIMAAENRILATNAAIPLLHERVIQGEAAGMKNAERDPRERQLVTPRSMIASGQP